MSRTLIYTEAGGDKGMGHVVRMGHLARELMAHGETVGIICEGVGEDYLKRIGLNQCLQIHKIDDYDTAIVDVPITDNNMLLDLGAKMQKIVMIVGTGWSITPATRQIADLIVYQGIGTPDRAILQSAGGHVLWGLYWLILGKDYVQEPVYSNDDYALLYVGGGIPRDYAFDVYREMNNLFDCVQIAPNDAEITDYMYDLQRSCSVFVTTFGVSVYEAMRLQKPIICFSRSQDHADTANRLMPWIHHIGIYDTVKPATIAHLALSQSVLPLNIEECPAELDGLGTERLARFILEEI